MIIRQAQKNDLKQISEVHARCFEDNFSTVVAGKSKYLLTKLYEEYLNKAPELFLVAIVDDKIVGFCMGYYCEYNEYQKKFLKHNLVRVSLRIFLLLITGNKAAWKKIKQSKTPIVNRLIVDNKQIKIKNENVDLLSICVLPEYKGKGVATELIDEYIIVIKKNNRKMCVLSVEKNNKRAIGFYQKSGFVITAENDISYIYTKDLKLE